MVPWRSSPRESFYEVLGVNFDASTQEIRTAFKKKALQLHPDKGGTKESFQLALNVFEILSEPRSRSRYDDHLKASFSEAPVEKAVSQRKRHGKKCDRPWRWDSSTATSHEQQRRTSTEYTAETSNTQQRKRSRTEEWQSEHPKKTRNGTSSGLGAEQTPHTTRDKNDQLLGFIHALLGKLSPAWRKIALVEDFSERQRLALESFLTKRKHPEGRHQSNSGMARGNRGSEVDLVRRISPSRSDCSNAGASEDALMLCDDDAQREPDCNSDVGDSDEQSDTNSRLDETALRLNISEVRPRRKHQNNTTCGPREGNPCKKPNLSGIKGISQSLMRGTAFYQSSVCVGCLIIGSRYVVDLRKAVDNLVVLTSIKQQILAAGEGTFEDWVRKAVHSALKEQGLTERSFGIWYTVAKVEIVPQSSNLLPSFPIFRDLERVLVAWSALEPFRKKRQRHSFTARDFWDKVLVFDRVWPNIEEAVSSVFHMAGHARKLYAKRLEAYKEATKLTRERLIEKWNSHALQLEERQQQNVRKFESRVELWNRNSMSREDRRAAIAGKDRLRTRLRQLLRRWASLDLSRRKKEAATEAQMRKRRNKNETRRRKEEAAARCSRWRWMNRADITMEEILSGRNTSRV